MKSSLKNRASHVDTSPMKKAQSKVVAITDQFGTESAPKKSVQIANVRTSLQANKTAQGNNTDIAQMLLSPDSSNPSQAQTGTRNSSRGKKVLQKYADSKKSGRQQMLIHIFSKLKEPTRERLEALYAAKLRFNPNEVYKDKTKSKNKVEPEIERFYRKITDSSDQIAVIGNVRPQVTVYNKLEDEELGSLLQFRVKRHCRNVSQNRQDEDLFFDQGRCSFGGGLLNLSDSRSNLNTGLFQFTELRDQRISALTSNIQSPLQAEHKAHKPSDSKFDKKRVSLLDTSVLPDTHNKQLHHAGTVIVEGHHEGMN